MPKDSKSRTITIVATAQPKAPDGVAFEMLENGQPVETLVFNKTVDDLWKDGHYDVTFQLQDNSGEDLRFPRKKKDALWVQRGGCPQSACHDGQFEAQQVDPSAGMWLNCKNKDDNQEELGFALNFVRRPDATNPNPRLIRYDPIISNQDGGTPRSLALNLLWVGAVATAVAALALAIFGRTRR